jgi:hypothetical protein
MKIRHLQKSFILLGLMALLPLLSVAGDITGSAMPMAVVDDQRYNRAIHIMVMLLIGFGFLMVFRPSRPRSCW